MGVLEKAARARQIRLQDNRDHSAKGAHLPFRELMLGMLRESRVIDLLHLRFLFEKTGYLHRVFTMPLHAQGECLEAPQSEKAVERSGNRADGVLQKRDLIPELLVLTNHDDAADHIGMAVQIFRRRMNDHVEAK